MKKLCILLTLLVSVLMLAGCGGTAQKSDAPANIKAQKSLVIYYSWSGTTQRLAQKIADYTKSDIAESHPLKAYPADYNDVAEQAKKEIETGFHPEIRDDLPNLKDYDVIYIGTPTWWYHMAPPLATYLEKHGAELAGKKIMPFCTNGGQEGSTLDDIAKAAPKATVGAGLSMPGGQVDSSGETIQKWVRQADKK